MATVQVRYIVYDVDAAIAFYTEQFGFKLEMHPAPPFAMLSMGDLRLVLSGAKPAERWRSTDAPMAQVRSREVGIGLRLKSAISLLPSRSCAEQEFTSEMTS